MGIFRHADLLLGGNGGVLVTRKSWLWRLIGFDVIKPALQDFRILRRELCFCERLGLHWRRGVNNTLGNQGISRTVTAAIEPDREFHV